MSHAAHPGAGVHEGAAGTGTQLFSRRGQESVAAPTLAPGTAPAQDACPQPRPPGPQPPPRAPGRTLPWPGLPQSTQCVRRGVCSFSLPVSDHRQLPAKATQVLTQEHSVSERPRTSGRVRLRCGPHGSALCSVWQRAQRQPPREATPTRRGAARPKLSRLTWSIISCRPRLNGRRPMPARPSCASGKDTGPMLGDIPNCFTME